LFTHIHKRNSSDWSYPR